MSFSVVMTNWERGDTLWASVNSILQQQGLNGLEILIIDDDSSDDSLEKAIALKRKHPDIIRVLETHESITQNICLPANIGFKRAKYDYVVLNPSDTIQMLPTNFQEHLKILKGNPNSWSDPQIRGLANWNTKTWSHAGGCTLKKHIHKITGFNEKMHGWGCIEPNWFERLRMIGVEPVKCNAYVCHVGIKLGGDQLKRREVNHENDLIHADNHRSRTYAPNSSWGEHPKLEEIL